MHIVSYYLPVVVGKMNGVEEKGRTEENHNKKMIEQRQLTEFPKGHFFYLELVTNNFFF